MSQAAPCGRTVPRWSVAGQFGAPAPALKAGLVTGIARVWVGPPFEVSGPRRGSVLGLSVTWVRLQVLPGSSRLLPSEEKAPAQPPADDAVLPATIVLRSV